jgi:hypothetical protein
MSMVTAKRLLIHTAVVFFLNGCAAEIDTIAGRDPVSSAASGVPKGDGTALVSWEPPTENTDDSVLTDLAGYKIYYGTFPGEYEKSITINNPAVTSYLIEDLGASDWFFVMTAFNSSQIESSYSEEMFKTVE